MEQSVVRAIGMCQVAVWVWCIGGQYGEVSCTGHRNVSGGSGCVWCMGGQYGAVSCVGDRNVSDGSGA